MRISRLSMGIAGVKRDAVEAAKWTRKAAEQGYAPTQADLGVLYWNGEGVPRDVFRRTCGSVWQPHRSRMRSRNAISLLHK
jgi:TPR repeat protein